MELFWIMKNLYLVGMRGTGKSTIGKLLAEELKKGFIDVDKKIEQRVGLSISEYVSKQGWEPFRELEKKQVEEMTLLQDTVISTGGGILMSFNNAQKLKDSGTLILLTASTKTLHKRLEYSSDRPALKGGNFLDELEQIWNERKDRYYQFADLIIDSEGKTPEETVQEIIREL